MVQRHRKMPLNKDIGRGCSLVTVSDRLIVIDPAAA